MKKGAVVERTNGNNTYDSQVIGGIFSIRENVAKALEALHELDIPQHDIQVIKLDTNQTKDPYTNFLVGRGFTHSQALYYDKGIRTGKALVIVYQVTNPASVIDAFDKYNAKYQINAKQPSCLSD